VKQYIDAIAKYLVSSFVMVLAIGQAARAEGAWLDFSVPEADVAKATPTPQVAPGPEVIHKSKQAAERIALDFSVPDGDAAPAPPETNLPKDMEVASNDKLPPPSPAPPVKPPPQPTPIEGEGQDRRVVNIARDWVGTQFKPGVSAQCAVFVRAVFKEAGIPLAISRNPFDKAVQWIDAHPARAQSFFGKDVGTLVLKQEDLRPGDLVGFKNTYGHWKPGAITHVGIVVDRKPDGTIMMVDRATRSAPIQYRSIATFKFAVGVRPYGYGEKPY
jgi:cell wall-associated NlpC family hydrolase